MCFEVVEEGGLKGGIVERKESLHEFGWGNFAFDCELKKLNSSWRVLLIVLHGSIAGLVLA